MLTFAMGCLVNLVLHSAGPLINQLVWAVC